MAPVHAQVRVRRELPGDHAELARHEDPLAVQEVELGVGAVGADAADVRVGDEPPPLGQLDGHAHHVRLGLPRERLPDAPDALAQVRQLDRLDEVVDRRHAESLERVLGVGRHEDHLRARGRARRRAGRRQQIEPRPLPEVDVEEDDIRAGRLDALASAREVAGLPDDVYAFAKLREHPREDPAGGPLVVDDEGAEGAGGGGHGSEVLTGVPRGGLLESSWGVGDGADNGKGVGAYTGTRRTTRVPAGAPASSRRSSTRTLTAASSTSRRSVIRSSTALAPKPPPGRARRRRRAVARPQPLSVTVTSRRRGSAVGA